MQRRQRALRLVIPPQAPSSPWRRTAVRSVPLPIPEARVALGAEAGAGRRNAHGPADPASAR